MVLYGDMLMYDSGFWNCDCMDAMREFPDKFFELAIDTRTYACYNMLEVIL